MSIELRPYLNFPGTAREALEFYRDIFGGELTATSFGEFHALPEDSPSNDKIMHAELISERIALSAADNIPESGIEFVAGTNVNLALLGEGPEDLAALSEAFDRLAEGGGVEMPLQVEMWGAHFGSLVDRFGINWMVNVGSGAEGGAEQEPGSTES